MRRKPSQPRGGWLPAEDAAVKLDAEAQAGSWGSPAWGPASLSFLQQTWKQPLAASPVELPTLNGSLCQWAPWAAIPDKQGWRGR